MTINTWYTSNFLPILHFCIGIVVGADNMNILREQLEKNAEEKIELMKKYDEIALSHAELEAGIFVLLLGDRDLIKLMGRRFHFVGGVSESHFLEAVVHVS